MIQNRGRGCNKKGLGSIAAAVFSEDKFHQILIDF
ncbi:hypothetical protein I656_02876 [Geobacillus sp. WSUCF1]|nr:hypothetical protein I656_02876 [Geobacillus sp. WSUCF1]